MEGSKMSTKAKHCT